MPRLVTPAPARVHAQKSLAESGVCFGVAITGLAAIAVALQMVMRFF